MFVLAVTAVGPASHLSATAQPSPVGVAVSLSPAITFVGGSVAERRTVEDAVGRFVEARLPLPDLEIRIRHGKAACGGSMGRFHPDPPRPNIELCFDREFLALHELAHAWEHFNLDDAARDKFVLLSGADAWAGRAVPHSHRAIERLADTIAFGLLSVAPSARDLCDPKIALFETLTGAPAPRLARVTGHPTNCSAS